MVTRRRVLWKGIRVTILAMTAPYFHPKGTVSFDIHIAECQILKYQEQGECKLDKP